MVAVSSSAETGISDHVESMQSSDQLRVLRVLFFSCSFKTSNVSIGKMRL